MIIRMHNRLQLKMDTAYVKGERIIITDIFSQTFTGVVKSVNSELGRILLSDVVQLPEHKSFRGFRNFDKCEIAEIKKCDADTSVADNRVCTDIEEEPVEPSAKLSECEYNKIKKLESECCYIRDFETDFHSAISHLRTCSLIAIYAKDVSKGRFGRASLLAISSPTNIFIFDLRALGDDILHKGLKEILESNDIIKVVYDCRQLSDCFKHKHLITLENIRDVEAEDVMVVFQERRTIRRHSRPLEYLLKVYLGVEMEGCDHEGEAWDVRPLPPNLTQALVSFVSLLIPLQEAIERKYLQLLIDASSVYNTHVRDLDCFDILASDPGKTLRKEIGKLLLPRRRTRGNFKMKAISLD